MSRRLGGRAAGRGGTDRLGGLVYAGSVALQLTLNHWSIPSDPRTNELHNELTSGIHNERCIKTFTVDSDY